MIRLTKQTFTVHLCGDTRIKLADSNIVKTWEGVCMVKEEFGNVTITVLVNTVSIIFLRWQVLTSLSNFPNSNSGRLWIAFLVNKAIQICSDLVVSEQICMQ